MRSIAHVLLDLLSQVPEAEDHSTHSSACQKRELMIDEGPPGHRDE
jgi:hypothetical protein